MLALVLISQLFNPVTIPKWNKTDKEIFEIIRQEAERLHKEEKHRREMAGKAGCPFEPGMYWNLDCA